MKIYAYEMKYTGSPPCTEEERYTPIREEEYHKCREIYNACFHDMRKALGIEPFDVLQDDGYLAEIGDNLFLQRENGVILGGVSCKGKELDDLFVNPLYRNRGIGTELLRFGMNRILNEQDEVILHVAEWNEDALKLYEKNGFVKTERFEIRRKEEC